MIATEERPFLQALDEGLDRLARALDETIPFCAECLSDELEGCICGGDVWL